MLGQNKVKTYDGFIAKMEKDIEGRFPTISQHITAINIDKNHLSADIRGAGLYVNTDSNVCQKKNTADGKLAVREVITDELKTYIDKSMDSLMKKGVTEAEAHQRTMDSLEPVMGYDPKTQQYVISARVPTKVEGQKDSLLEQTSIPMWNIGWLTKIIKQPFATSHAKNLVSVESFGNAWADVIGLFKESLKAMVSCQILLVET